MKQCTWPGCETIVLKGRCAKHPYPDRSGPVNPKYLSAHWKRLRAKKLRADPLCDECFSLGQTVPAGCVDHIDGNSENDAPENLRSLCVPCHSRKTASVDGGFGNVSGSPRPPTGLDGWPVAKQKEG